MNRYSMSVFASLVTVFLLFSIQTARAQSSNVDSIPNCDNTCKSFIKKYLPLSPYITNARAECKKKLNNFYSPNGGSVLLIKEGVALSSNKPAAKEVTDLCRKVPEGYYSTLLFLDNSCLPYPKENSNKNMNKNLDAIEDFSEAIAGSKINTDQLAYLLKCVYDNFVKK